MCGFEVRIDRQDLPKLKDWERELLDFIRQADSVVLIVSPHSLASKVVEWELEQVRSNRKRLAPVMIADIEGGVLPREIAKINYPVFSDPALLEQRADELASALNADIAWIKEHTRLGEAARRWLERGKPEDALVRGQGSHRFPQLGFTSPAWGARSHGRSANVSGGEPGR